MEIELRIKVKLDVETVGGSGKVEVLEVAQERETAKETEGQLELFAHPVAEAVEKPRGVKFSFTRPIWVKFSDKREADRFSSVNELCAAVAGRPGSLNVHYNGVTHEECVAEFKRRLAALVKAYTPWRSVEMVARETKYGRRVEA